VSTLQEEQVELRLRHMFSVIADDTRSEAPVAFLHREPQAIETVTAPSPLRSRWSLVAVFVAVALLIATAVALRAAEDHDAPRRVTRPADQPSVAIPPVAHDGWDPNVPRSVPAPADPTLQHMVGERYPVSGPDGNWAGYGDFAVLQAVPNMAATPDNPEAAVSAYMHEFVPLTKTADPRSELVGYLLRGYGFVSLSKIEAPGFDVDALIAESDAGR
jgi:hypothetical protein